MKFLSGCFVRRMVLVCVVLFVACGSAQASPAKNVILMISDGAGFNLYNSASYYSYGKLGGQMYDNFPVKLGCTTYSADVSGYDPQRIWTDFEYARKATDSAAAATALNTGVKTKNGKIGKNANNKNMITLAQFADSFGKATGTVSSVQFSHATPAAVWAHNKSRNNYEQIAKEMLYDTGLDVIMGAGHPRYDNDGGLLANDDWAAKYCGGIETYKALTGATTKRGWVFIDSMFDFQALANNINPEFDRVIGLAQVGGTLQQGRTDSDDLSENVPTLCVMAKAAINVLNKDKDGFYLMIEGGAVDWANHGNDLERAVQEQVDFNKAVDAVVGWVEKYSNWKETLLIVTADHETGQIWGPDANDKNYQLPVNNGKGKLPSVKYFHSGHTNALVPLYAIGNGSEKFKELVDGTDGRAGLAWGFSGDYVDNTDIFTAMKEAITAE